MNDKGKTKEELIKELQELQQENNSLKASYDKDLTERKQAEEALSESENRLSSIYNTVGDIIFHLAVVEDGSYRFISVNQAFCKVTGLNQEMIVGKLVNEVIPEPSLSMVLGKYRQAIKENAIIRWEETSDYPTGRLIGDVSIAPVIDYKGNCTHLVGSVHDITERKYAKETLQESEKNLQEKVSELSLLNHASFSLLEFYNTDYVYNFLGENIFQISGADYMIISEYNEQNKSTSIRQMFGVQSYIEKLVKIVGIDLRQIEIPVKDLTDQRDLLLRRKIYHVEGGLYTLTTQKIPKVVCTSIEKVLRIKEIYSIGFIWKGNYHGGITWGFKKGNQLKKRDLIESVVNQAALALSRKLAENALIQSEQRYQTLARVSPVGIFRTDTTGNTTYVNPKYCQISGLSAVGAFGDSWLRAVHTEDREKLNTIWFASTQKHLASSPIEFRFVRPDGSIVWVLGQAVQEKNDKEEIAGYVGTITDITERKRAEESLRESETKLKEAQKIGKIGNWEFDVLTQKIKWSDQVFELFERDIQLGPPSAAEEAKYYTEEQAKVLRDFAQQSIETAMEFNFDIEPILPSGRKVYFTTNLRPVKNGNGKIINLFGTVQDITELKQAEASLKQASEWQESIIEGSRDAIFISDQDSRFLAVNNAACDLTGYSREQLLKMRIPDIHDLPDLDAYKMYHQRIFDGEEILSEAKIRHSNGSKIDTEFNNRCVSIAGKLYMHTTARNITERKRDEIIQQIQFNIASKVVLGDTLEQLFITIREELNQLLDTTNFFVALYNQETDTLRQVIYEDQKEHFTEWKSCESLSGQVIKLAKTLLLKKPEIIEFAAEKKLNLLGTPAECWLGVPLIINKQPIGVMVVQSYTNQDAYDQTSSDLLELIARELGHYIERRRMIEDLVVAQKKAEENDRLKSAFLANMSHEIRTPMNGILGFTELLKEPDLSGEEQKSYISLIEKGGERLLNIINDIISISKIESGQMEISISETNINKQIEFLYNFFKPEAEQKGLQIKIRNSLPAKESIIKTDQEKIYAILTNLIKNALKFTNKGSIEFGYEKKGEYFEFFVKDSGIGIPKDKQEVVFERFAQVDIFDKQALQGAGLGLSIAKAYAEMLGGKIWLESKEGKGSIFYFTIPYNTMPEEKEVLEKVVSGESKEVQIEN